MAMAQREHGETIVAGPGHDGGFTVTWALAVERLRRDIQVKLTKAEPGAGRPTTVAFSIMFRWRHPETVARVANALAAFYVEENGKIRERQASAARLTRLTQELAQMQEVYT